MLFIPILNYAMFKMAIPMKSPWFIYLFYGESAYLTIKYILSSYFAFTTTGSIAISFQGLKNYRLGISGITHS